MKSINLSEVNPIEHCMKVTCFSCRKHVGIMIKSDDMITFLQSYSSMVHCTTHNVSHTPSYSIQTHSYIVLQIFHGCELAMFLSSAHSPSHLYECSWKLGLSYTINNIDRESHKESGGNTAPRCA